MYFNKFQFRLEEIIEKNGGKKRGTSYAFPDFLGESERNCGTPCFFLATKETGDTILIH
jgi:hypothetical protein